MQTTHERLTVGISVELIVEGVLGVGGNRIVIGLDSRANIPEIVAGYDERELVSALTKLNELLGICYDLVAISPLDPYKTFKRV